MLNSKQKSLILDLLDQEGVNDVYFWRDNLVVINDYDFESVERILAGCALSSGVNFILDSDTQDQLVA